MKVMHNILRLLFVFIVLGHFLLGLYRGLPLRGRQTVGKAVG